MANNKVSTPKFDSEKDFIRFYLKIPDKRQQIEEIKKYREWLARLDESKAALIRTIAENLYTERTQHFFLELLQNADDNKYDPGVEPAIQFDYPGGAKLTIKNNEMGFSAEDVYSITTAALSTKYLSDDSAYIGEKGIGFKSVFAVAERVDIHSNGYHFSLYTGEYIVPHWIEEPYRQTSPTEIVLHLKQDDKLPQKIASNLRELSGQTLGMILFLRKLRCIVIKASDGKTEQIRLVDTGNYRELYSNGRPEARYYLHKYTEKVSSAEIEGRYPRLYKDKAVKSLKRDIIFAVPDPAVMDLGSFKGSYFAFLQTRMETGLRMHIQTDAETTTNREQYTLMSDSPWNAKMLANLEKQIYRLFLDLRNEPNFRDRLPEFFPGTGDKAVNGNEDAQDLVNNIRRGLGRQPLFLDRNGAFKKADELILISAQEPEIFYAESKYEKHIKDLLPTDRKYKAGMTFVDPGWNCRYHRVLAGYGVYRTEAIDHFILLRAGPPKSVRLSDYLSVVQFNQQLYLLLQEVRDCANPGETTQEFVQSAKIFPAVASGKSGQRREWVPAGRSKELRWQDVASKSARVPSKSYLYIDAEFTYRPGGSTKNREAVSRYNGEYREFLARIGIKPHSLLNSLMDAHLRPLARGRNLGPQAAEAHWVAIYAGFWLKQSILERERKEVVQEFLDLLPTCQLPVLIADNDKTHTTRRASECFVGDTQRADATRLFREYRGSEAPIVHFAGFSDKAKLKWHDWREFLESKCGVHSGPYLVPKTLKTDNEINKSISSFFTGDGDMAMLNPFFAEIARAVKFHPSYKEEYGSFQINYGQGGKYKALDRHSHYILRSGPDSDYLARELSGELWSELEPGLTVNVSWKYKTSAIVSAANRYFEAYVIPHLPLRDSAGNLVRHGERAFHYAKANRDILGALGVYVRDSDYHGNFAFLDAWGVKREVDALDVLQLHDACAKNLAREAATPEDYVPHLRVVCNYLKGLAQDKDIILKSIQMWNPELAAPQPPRLWIRSAKQCGYPEDLIADVRRLFVERDDLSAEELLDALFQGEHQLDHNLYKIIADLGAKTAGAESRLFDAIDDRFEEYGIELPGRTVQTPEELPVVWLLNLGFDREDAAAMGIWVLPPDAVSDSFMAGLRLLGWPTSEDLPKNAEFGEERALTSTELYKLKEIYCADGEKAQDGRTTNPTGLEIMQRIISNAIVICRGLYFGVNGTMLQTQYALHDKLYLDGSIDPLFRLMYRLGGGAKPEMMKLLWDTMDSQEEPAAVETQEDSRERKLSASHETGSSEAKAGSGAGLGGGAGTYGGGTANRKAGEQTGETSRPLMPYAFYRSGIYASKPFGIPDDAKRETGKKGEEIVVKAEEAEGRTAEIQPENNPGFDLISQDETEERYIEVKTVNGVWGHVLLTRSEFAAAQKYGDRYWVYVVELLGDGKHRLTHIQDPFARVTHYSLDDGWRVVENPSFHGQKSEYDDLYSTSE